MSRDWERNFTNTMRETEDNLSRMRNRLDPARYKPIDSTLIDSPPDPAEQLSNGIPKIRLKTSPKVKERPVSAILTSSSPSYELYRHSTPSAGLVALLSEKLERQNKVIEQLSHQVQDLESDRRKNDVKVRDLEHQVNTLTTRMTENRGQYNTEQQIDDWQRDVRNRLDELHERITRQVTNSGPNDTYYSESALTVLARDLHEAKRMLQAECNALHHEIETLRTRLVKQEMDVTGQLMEGKEMGRRMDRLDRKLGKVQSDQHQVLSHHLGLSSSTHQTQTRPYSAQNDIRDLKTEMSKLLASFSKLESASQVSRSSTGSAPSVVSTTTVSSTISGRRHRSYPSSVSSSSTKGPTVVSSSWQRVRHHKERGKEKRGTKLGNSDGSDTSLEDLSSSEISLPLSISHEEEEDAEKKREEGGNQLVDEDEDDEDDDVDVDDFQDDLSLYLSDLDVSHKGEDFGSTISLDSGNLDLDFM